MHSHVQHRERLDRRVEAGVVAERALRRALARLDVALQHDLRVRRHLQRHGEAVDHLDPLAAQEPGEQVLVDVAGQRRRWRRTTPPGRSRSRSPPAAAARAARRRRGARSSPCGSASACRACCGQCCCSRYRPRLRLPVSGCLRVGQPEVVEDPAVAGPGLQPGQPVQVDVGSLVDDLLAGRALHLLRRHGLELHQLAQPVADAGPADRQLGPDQLADAVADLVDARRRRAPSPSAAACRRG